MSDIDSDASSSTSAGSEDSSDLQLSLFTEPGSTPTTTSSCARCLRPAELTCSLCDSAPWYEAKSTWYCSSQCGYEDAQRHHNLCTKLQDRKRLHRAARLLQSIVLLFNETFFLYNITKIEQSGDEILLHEGSYEALETQGASHFYKFPDHLVENQQLKNSILMFMAGEDIFLFPPHLLRACLDDLVEDSDKDLELMGHIRAEETLKMRLVNHDHMQTPQSHQIRDFKLLRVRTKTGDDVVIDLSALQFGDTEPARPSLEYGEGAGRVSMIKKSKTLTAFYDTASRCSRKYARLELGYHVAGVFAGLLGEWAFGRGLDGIQELRDCEDTAVFATLCEEMGLYVKDSIHELRQQLDTAEGCERELRRLSEVEDIRRQIRAGACYADSEEAAERRGVAEESADE